MRRYVVLILSLLLIILLAACGNDDAKDDKGTEEATQIEVSDEEKVEEDKVVADVNGVEITGDIYNFIYVLTKVQLGQIGQDIEDLASLKEATLDILIRQELVIQDAKIHGITVSEEEVDSEFKDLKSENEEEFTAMLDKYGLSEDAYKGYLTFALIHEKYLDLPEMEISDNKAEEKYEELKKESDNLPEFDSIKDQIKVGMKQDKLQVKVDELKEKAKIEMFI